MKRLSYICTLIACTMAVSCNDTYVDPYDIPVDYYVCGYNPLQGNSTIYKNSEIVYTLGGSVRLGDIALQKNDIYAVGNRNGAPYVCKNGEEYPVSALSGKQGDITKIYIVDDVRYCCGHYTDAGTDTGFIMVNDDIWYTLDNAAFSVMDFGPNGDIYVGGTIDGGPRFVRVNRDSWKAVETVDLNKAGIPGTFTVNDIYVGNRDITVALNRTTEAETTAYGWIDDALFPLSGKASNAYSTAIYNGWCAFGGNILTNPGMDYTACQWGNFRGGFIAEDFSYGCNPGDSGVVMLYNGGYNLYQVVESPGQLQLCRNGQLRVRIDCADSFHATGWLVVRK